MSNSAALIEPSVSFLTNEKSGDWRFSTHTKLGVRESKKVYWIGILDLRNVTSKKYTYPLSFFNGRSPVEDFEFPRDIDGASLDQPTRTIFYDFQEIITKILELKKDYVFAHFLLEEETNERGDHRVSILHLDDKVARGFAIPSRHHRWYDEPVRKWYELLTYPANLILDAKRLTINSNQAYQWHK
jgi:hypothetical protein